MALSLERKIAGNNFLFIILSVLTLFTLVTARGSDLVDWGTVGFEVLMPFFVAIMVCEWVKTLSDPLIDVITVQARSLFLWVVGRFLVVFGLVGALCVACMAACDLILPHTSTGEMFIVYLGTAFFLSSLGVLVSLFTRQPHGPAAACGTVWFFCLMVRAAVLENLDRCPVIGYLYPFIRFVAPESPAWTTNKAVLFLLGIGIWIGVYRLCGKRNLRL